MYEVLGSIPGEGGGRGEGGRGEEEEERGEEEEEAASAQVAILRPSNALKSESKPRGHLKLASPWVLLSDLSINSMLSLN